MRSALATRDRNPRPDERIRFAPVVHLEVELRRDVHLPPEDAAALDRLITSRPNVGIFLSRAWLAGFLAEPPPGAEHALVLFREAGALRAIAAVTIRRTLTHVQVGVLGGGLGSDRVDLLAARGFEALASDVFLRWIRDSYGEGAFILELRDVPAESPLWGAARRAGAERTLRLTLQPREVHTLPYLDLTEPWPNDPSFWHSSSLTKHRRWLEHRGRLRIERLDDIGDVMRAFEWLRRFLHVRWNGRSAGSVLDDPRVVRFHQRVLPLLLTEGRLRMIRLLADTRTIGVFYGLASAGWWGYYLAGYDRSWAGRIHLGQITLAAAIDAAAAEGAREFDFLKGAERVKYLWPVRERTTLDADVYSERSGAQLTRAGRASRDAAAAVVKSARALLS
jgi:CelD/BcsL family acetyltransferase involved in cellulose biosynthesis